MKLQSQEFFFMKLLHIFVRKLSRIACLSKIKPTNEDELKAQNHSHVLKIREKNAAGTHFKGEPE
jgi:hypothetical protein